MSTEIKNLNELGHGPAVDPHAGGLNNHKPDCRCRPCKSRRRKEETISQSAGKGGGTMAPFPTKFPFVSPDNPDTFIANPLFLDKEDPIGRKARIAKWLELKYTDPNMTFTEAARLIGISRSHLSALIKEATSEGWLKFSDPIERLDQEIIPRVLDNLDHFLKIKDRATTIATAQGTIFKIYQDAKGVSDAPQTVLALKIETVEPGNVKVLSGTIVGKPKELGE